MILTSNRHETYSKQLGIFKNPNVDSKIITIGQVVPEISYSLLFSRVMAAILNFGSGNQTPQSHDGKQPDSYSREFKDLENCCLQKSLGGGGGVSGWLRVYYMLSGQCPG